MATIDIHAHLGRRWDDVQDPRGSCADLAAADREAGVSSSVASSLESLLSATALGAPDDGRMERRLLDGNEELLAWCRDRSWLRMAVVVDPRREESLRQAPRMLGSPSVVAVKLHPDRHHYRVGEHLGAVLQLLGGFPGKAALVHCTGTAYSQAAPMVELAAVHAGVPVIIAHLGRTEPPDLVIELIRRSGVRNVYVDTSAMRDAGMVQRAIGTIGAERILFGSDFPFYHPREIIALIRSSGASSGDVERILSGNFRELFPAA